MHKLIIDPKSAKLLCCGENIYTYYPQTNKGAFGYRRDNRIVSCTTVDKLVKCKNCLNRMKY